MIDSREENKTKRRDKKKWWRKTGMRVSGRRLAELMRNVILKKRKESGKE